MFPASSPKSSFPTRGSFPTYLPRLSTGCTTYNPKKRIFAQCSIRISFFTSGSRHEKRPSTPAGNRTRVTTLEGSHSTTELQVFRMIEPRSFKSFLLNNEPHCTCRSWTWSFLPDIPDLSEHLSSAHVLSLPQGQAISPSRMWLRLPAQDAPCDVKWHLAFK